ncbi:MAG: tetratricopeptide repeat protein [Chloroflexi bacterium]|nr:tetratricopeptide repeat protein [Chloroflexota bacterium]
MLQRNIKIKLGLLAVIILFLAWNAFQPEGWLETIRQNIWTVRMINDRLPAQEAITNPPHSTVLLARSALEQGQPQIAMDLLSPLLSYQDRATKSMHAEVLYALGRQTEAVQIWEDLNETILLERAAGSSTYEGGEQILLAANQSLYRLDEEKYTSSLALTLKSQGQLSEAERLFLASREAYPESEYASNWLRYLADIYTDTGDWQKAEQVYLQTIEENPEDTKAWRNLGLLYSSGMNDHQKAIEIFQKMISLSPENDYGYLLLAQSYEKAGDSEKALRTYQALLEIVPGNETALQAIDRLSGNED